METPGSSPRAVVVRGCWFCSQVRGSFICCQEVVLSLRMDPSCKSLEIHLSISWSRTFRREEACFWTRFLCVPSPQAPSRWQSPAVCPPACGKSHLSCGSARPRGSFSKGTLTKGPMKGHGLLFCQFPLLSCRPRLIAFPERKQRSHRSKGKTQWAGGRL